MVAKDVTGNGSDGQIKGAKPVDGKVGAALEFRRPAYIELGQPRDEVEDMIRDLVGKQLFSGAINWDRGILYSVESQQLTEGKNCPNCGSQVEFAGKGVIACPYCGSEVFLTKRAAAATAA